MIMLPPVTLEHWRTLLMEMPSVIPEARCVAGLRVLDPEEYGGDPAAGAAAAERELKEMLEGLAQHLFGSGTEVYPALPYS